MEDLINLIRKSYPETIAKDICSVQPVGPVDWEALSQHPLWQSFVQRHIKKPAESQDESDT